MKTSREYIRPLELVGLAGVMGLFVAFTACITTRQIRYALIFGGVAFIVTLVIISTLTISINFDSNKDRKSGR